MRIPTETCVRVCVSGLVLLATTSLLLTGCKPSAEKIAAREEMISREVDSFFAKIQEFQAEGKFAEAFSLIDEKLNSAKYAAHKERFFAQKTDLLLAQGNEAAAGDLIIAAWHSEPKLARSVFGRLYNHYKQQNNNTAITAWCKRLLGLGPNLPSDLRSQVLDWQLTAGITLKDIAASQASIDDIMGTLKPEEAAPLMQRALGGLIDAGQQALASTLVSHIASKRPDSPLYSELVVTLSMRCILAAGDWDKVPAAFQACFTQLPDDPLLTLMRTVFSTLQKNNRKELVEESSKQAIFNVPNKTNAVNFASRIWVESGVAADKKLLPERLDALLTAKISPTQVGNLFDRYFYEMVDNLDIIRGLCSLGERILLVCSDETTVNNLKVKILDGAFIVSDFDLAVHMLEQGIPGKDKAWHDMSLPKVKAHRAMAQNKPREAIKYFRDFMNEWIGSKQEEEYDPTSGIAYSREWILGRNANRIAGIWDSISEKEEAAKARDEAKAYFKIALEKAKSDAEALKLIKEETKGMGLQ